MDTDRGCRPDSRNRAGSREVKSESRLRLRGKGGGEGVASIKEGRGGRKDVAGRDQRWRREITLKLAAGRDHGKGECAAETNDQWARRESGRQVCVRACVRAYVRLCACMRACRRARVYVCVRACARGDTWGRGLAASADGRTASSRPVLPSTEQSLATRPPPGGFPRSG